MPGPTPQRRLGEIEVDDPSLLKDLRTLTELDSRLHPLLEKRRELTAQVDAEIRSMRENYEEGDVKARVAETEANLLVQYKRRIHDGVQLRVGEYVIEVKEYATMEKVEQGKGFRCKRPLLVDDVSGEDVSGEDDD